MVEPTPPASPSSEPQAPEPTVPELSDLDKLKASNDATEKELVRGRELKAEGQKLEAEKQLAGTTGGNVVPAEPVKLTDDEYTNKFMKGEVDPLTEDDITI